MSLQKTLKNLRTVIQVANSKRGTQKIVSRVIYNANWFEIRHLFGFWMMSDVDTIWLDAPGADAHYYTLCVGGAESRPGKISFAWVCPNCGELFNTRSFAADGGRFESCLEASEALVNEFNSSQSLRTCPACGNIHPESYGFYPDRDSAAARQMRVRCD